MAVWYSSDDEAGQAGAHIVQVMAVILSVSFVLTGWPLLWSLSLRPGSSHLALCGKDVVVLNLPRREDCPHIAAPKRVACITTTIICSMILHIGPNGGTAISALW